MPEPLIECKCLERDDKNLLLNIINDAIDKDNAELRKIEAIRRRAALRPPGFVESFVGIRSSLSKMHEQHRDKMQKLKERIDTYPKCSSLTVREDIKINVAYPGYSEKFKKIF